MSLSFLRLRVEDFRGLTAAELTFPERGVTVVHAPNESGKSSLFEAVELLLTTKDTSRAGAVKRTQPVGRDVGSLVELELRCGAHHLTCRKRFHRHTLTELEVHEPVHQQLAGEEAHNRLVEILGGEVDEVLRRALWFQQGRGLAGVALHGSLSLAAGLDAVAGGAGVDGGVQDTLLERARTEFERYFTSTGKQGKVLTTSADELAAAQDQLVQLDAQLAELAGELATLREAEDRINTCTEDLAVLGPALQEQAAAAAALDRLADALRALEADRGRLASVASAAERDVADRDDLVARVDRLVEEERALTERLTPAREERTALASRLTTVEDELAELTKRSEAARSAMERADAVAALARERVALAQLRDQLAGADGAARELAEAEAFLDRCVLTAEGLDELRRLHLAAEVARGRLDATSPTVTVRAEAALKLSWDGAAEEVASGSTASRTVRDRATVTVPGVAEVQVTAGTPVEALQTEAERASEAFTDACRRAGVADLAEGAALVDERRSRESVRDRAQEVLAAALAGTTRQALRDELEAAEARFAELAERAGDAEPADPVAAEEAAAAGRRSAEDAVRERDDARSARDELRSRMADTDTAIAGAEALLGERSRELAAAQGALAAARAETGDEGLAAAAAAAAKAATAKEVELTAARERFQEQNPEAVRLQYENTQGQLERTRRDLGEAREQRARSQARVGSAGEKGLGEQRARADELLTGRRDAHERLCARADAAKALFEALADAREQAYRQYREPLRAAIVEIGRLIFGPDLDVELDGELNVVRRTLGGTTVAWAELSSGAREQLAVITALAAATLASDGGTPLVLDDCFGYSDPVRLERLGAVLGAVDTAQIVVLTCDPERFRVIGRPAAVVSLRGRAAPTTEVVPVVARSAAVPAEPAAAVELLECEACGRTWERQRARGRKPRRCPSCA